MKKIYIFFVIGIMSGCTNKNEISPQLLDSIIEIHIKNRAANRFGGIEEYKIKEKTEIISFYRELVSLKNENNLTTKPFKGTILIDFMTKDKDGTGQYINYLSTDVVFKPNNEYFIDYWRGKYISDHFLARILKYLQVDETKVSALDNYRKSQERSIKN